MVQALIQEPVATHAGMGFERANLSHIPVEVSTDLGNYSNASHRLKTPTAHASRDKDTINIEMQIQLPEPPKPKPKPPKIKKAYAMTQTVEAPPVPQHTVLSLIVGEQRFIEPQYFQNVDCVGMPNFFSPTQCRQIIEVAEEQGFSAQRRHSLLDLQWTDLVDPVFASRVWALCGLENFLQSLTIDGMVPCGLNDVIRIQKYVEGSVFGRHTDQSIERSGGRVSKYSLRVFLNSREEFSGGLSAFNVPFRAAPVVFAPETGLALVYPQGDHCTVQEEQVVLSGVKYVLRADILFGQPLQRW